MVGNIQKKITILTLFKSQGFKTAAKNMHGWRMGMAASIDEMRGAQTVQGKWNRNMKLTNTAGGRAALTFRKMVHGMKGFKMEMLGVMFFGMSLTRIVGSLMGKSLEWTGVMEVMASALGILFLPVALKLLDWAILFLDWVDSLSESQKLWLGNTLLVVGALGILLTIIGTMALGIGSLILVFGKLFGIHAPAKLLFTFLKGAFTGLSATVAIVVAIVVAIIIGMVKAFKENFLGMKTVVMIFVESFKILFGGIVKIIKGVIELVAALIAGDWSRVWDALVQIFSGIWDVIRGGLTAFVSGLVAIFIGAVRAIKGIIEFILKPFVWVYGKILSLMSDLATKIVNAFESILPKWLIDILRKGISFTKALGGNMMDFLTGKRALGGPVSAGGSYLVGERGPEIFTPSASGDITANNQLGGGSQNITINAQISSDYDVRRMADELKKYWVDDFERTSQGRSV